MDNDNGCKSCIAIQSHCMKRRVKGMQAQARSSSSLVCYNSNTGRHAPIMKPEASRVMHIMMPLHRGVNTLSGACALMQHLSLYLATLRLPCAAMCHAEQGKDSILHNRCHVTNSKTERANAGCSVPCCGLLSADDPLLLILSTFARAPRSWRMHAC